MSGLLIKELLCVRKQSKTFVVFLAFYAVLFLMLGGIGFSMKSMTSILIPVMVMLTVVLVVNSVSYDEAAKWDGFARSLALSSKRIVGSKYLFVVIFSAIGVVLSCMAELMASNGRVEPEDMAALCAGAGAAPLIICAILLPLFYKFGLQKARLVLMILCLLPAVVYPLVRNTGFSMTNDQVLLLLKLSPMILLVIVGASYLISCGVYGRREV